MRFSGYALLLLLAVHTDAAETSVIAKSCAKPPLLDGVLDDECWQTAALLSDFVQIRPGDNAKPSSDTAILLARDATALYIGIRASQDPSSIRATMARRDAVL